MEKLQSAIALYEDDYLPDCCYSDWANLERENYRHKYLAATERLARIYMQSQRWDDTINVCQAALRRDKCWEPAYILSMQAYASQGNIPQAQEVYQRCETNLREELGLAPSTNTQRLRQLITKGY